MSKESQSITDLLRASGLQATAPRHAVLDWLDKHPHATAQQVHAGARKRLGTLSRQAAYDVLSACVAAGLVRQIRPAGHPAHFERRAGDNHHHLVCRDCGRIEDSACRNPPAPCLQPEQDHGFAIDEAEIVFWGLCRECRGRAATTDESNSSDTM